MPYITGIDQYLDGKITPQNLHKLKAMGAATASSGATTISVVTMPQANGVVAQPTPHCSLYLPSQVPQQTGPIPAYAGFGQF